MNSLEIIILIITVLLAYAGYRRGFVLRLASMLSLVLSVSLVSALLPQITEFIKNETPVYRYIESECRRVVAEQFVNSYLEQNEVLQEWNVAEHLNDAGISLPNETIMDAISLTRVQQNEIIENLPFPERIRSMLLDYNNDEGYRRLNVTTFQDYIVNFIATAILNVVSYILCIILVQLLLRSLFTVLGILSHLPVIGFVNRLLGLGFGLIEALFLLWIFFLVLSMLTAMPIGQQLFAMVEESRVLSCLYESNLFLKLVLGAAAIFLY